MFNGIKKNKYAKLKSIIQFHINLGMLSGFTVGIKLKSYLSYDKNEIIFSIYFLNTYFSFYKMIKFSTIIDFLFYLVFFCFCNLDYSYYYIVLSKLFLC